MRASSEPNDPKWANAIWSSPWIWVPLGLLFLGLAYFPVIHSMLFLPNTVGPFDWELFAAYLEAFRKIVQEYGQFPWWNPYSAGGFPHFGNSLTYGAFSLPAILSLIFGSLAALKISVVATAVFGFAGMYLLASRIASRPQSRVLAALIFACNGGIVIHLAVGHLFWEYFLFPWILYFLTGILLRPDSRLSLKYAVLCGAALGLSAQSAIHYGFVYKVLTIAGFFFYSVWKFRRDWPKLRSLTFDYLLLSATFLAIGGFRLLICLQVNSDFPRIQRWEINAGLIRTLKVFFLPGQTIRSEGGAPLGWWEWGCYVGVLGFALFLISLRKGIRFYHLLCLAGVLMFLRTTYPWPYFWLSSYVPLFKTMRLATRIRIWIMPFFALGVASGLDVVRTRSRHLALGLAILVMADICGNSAYVFYRAFYGQTENPMSAAWKPNPNSFPLTYQDQLGKGSSLFRTVEQNYTHTPGYEPAVSPLLWERRPAENPLRGINSPEYRGEFYTDLGKVEPHFWSPNRIEFEGIHGKLHLNMNLGSYWLVNGQPIFAQYKVAEMERSLEVEPDVNGRIVLEVWPKGFKLACIVTGMAWILAAALWFVGIRYGDRGRKAC